jgi:hypothetical protein
MLLDIEIYFPAVRFSFEFSSLGGEEKVEVERKSEKTK